MQDLHLTPVQSVSPRPATEAHDPSGRTRDRGRQCQIEHRASPLNARFSSWPELLTCKQSIGLKLLLLYTVCTEFIKWLLHDRKCSINNIIIGKINCIMSTQTISNNINIINVIIKPNFIVIIMFSKWLQCHDHSYYSITSCTASLLAIAVSLL